MNFQSSTPAKAGVLQTFPKESLEAFGQRMLSMQDAARLQIANSQKATREDPVYIQHQAQRGNK